MFCTKCGRKLASGTEKCPFCDSADINSWNRAGTIKLATSTGNTAETGYSPMSDIGVSKADIEKFHNVYMEPDEVLIAKLGNGYLTNLLYFRMKKSSGLLTDRRIYLKGTLYYGQGKLLMKQVEERIVDVEDVTGTGFIYNAISWITIVFCILIGIVSGGFILENSNSSSLAWIIGLAVIAVGIFVAVYSRRILFFIEYAGGRICIDAKQTGLSEVQDFHKQIRQVKDRKKPETL